MGYAISNLQLQFQTIVDQHYADLWAYVHGLTAAAAESEDILHQAFLLAFDHLAAGGAFRTDAVSWLRGTIRNLVFAWWRQKRKLPANLADHLEELAAQAAESLAPGDDERFEAALRHCIEKLATEDRALVARRYQDGLPVKDIARQADAKVATVRVRLFRARQILKTCIERQVSGSAAS